MLLHEHTFIILLYSHQSIETLLDCVTELNVIQVQVVMWICC